MRRGGARGDRALQPGQDLVRRGRLELAAVEAGALARVAGGPGGLDEREQRVAVAVVADRAHRLGVAGRRALVPQLLPRAAPEVQLAGRARARERLGVHVGEREHLARVPVLDHAGHEALRVVGDRGVVHGTADRSIRAMRAPCEPPSCASTGPSPSSPSIPDPHRRPDVVEVARRRHEPGRHPHRHRHVRRSSATSRRTSRARRASAAARTARSSTSSTASKPFGAFAERTLLEAGRRLPAARRARSRRSPCASASPASPPGWRWSGAAGSQRARPCSCSAPAASSGQIAVQAAKLLGAGRVVAAARNPEGLERARELGADATVSLAGERPGGARCARPRAAAGYDVVLDPLWGAPAVAAIGAHGAVRPARRAGPVGGRRGDDPLGRRALQAGRHPRLHELHGGRGAQGGRLRRAGRARGRGSRSASRSSATGWTTCRGCGSVRRRRPTPSRSSCSEEARHGAGHEGACGREPHVLDAAAARGGAPAGEGEALRVHPADPRRGRLRAPGRGRPGSGGLDARDRAAPAHEGRARSEVDSRVGGPDPFTAVKEALADGDYDEIIISTLPRRSSTWLRRDLVRRVERLGLPVTAIVPGKARLSKEEQARARRDGRADAEPARRRHESTPRRTEWREGA